jgi:hypothetical protein
VLGVGRVNGSAASRHKVLSARYCQYVPPTPPATITTPSIQK